MKYLILGGGGLTCSRYLGCMEYMFESNMFDHLEEIVGCSMGSVIGLLVLLGYRPIEIKEHMKQLSIRFDCFDIMSFIDDWGLDDYETNVLLIVRNMVSKKLGNRENLTINDIENYSKKKLYIISFNLTNNKMESMDKNIDIYLCLKASMCIPFYTKKTIINGCLYVDPGCNNYGYPYNFFKDKNDKDILGFRMMEYGIKNVNHLIDYISILVDKCISYQNYEVSYIVHNLYSRIPFIPLNWSKEKMSETLDKEFIEGYEYIRKRK